MPVLKRGTIFDIQNYMYDSSVSDSYMKRILDETRESRLLYISQLEQFRNIRFFIELSVKAAVTATLAVALLVTSTPAALLVGGAALTLFMSSIVYRLFDLKPLEFSIPSDLDNEQQDSEQQLAAQIRNQWKQKSEESGYSNKQSRYITYMTWAGLVLVGGFAIFAAITSGMSIPLGLACMAFATALFYKGLDSEIPYIERILLPKNDEVKPSGSKQNETGIRMKP